MNFSSVEISEVLLKFCSIPVLLGFMYIFTHNTGLINVLNGLM